MLDNYSVAILTAVNDLAGRFGLQPYDFVAVLDLRADEAKSAVLRFESPPATGQQANFDRMLAALGADEAVRVTGTERELFDSIQHAIHKAPTKRVRH